MPSVRLTVTESACRSGLCKAGDTFLVGDVCPPICCELWHAAWPYVLALRSGGALDCGEEKARSFTVQCPDGGRVKLRGESVDDG